MGAMTGFDPRTIAAFDAVRGMGMTSGVKGAFDAAAVSSGLVFLESELEKRDPKVGEPLTGVFWMRDIPIDEGGGWVDFTSNFFADYANAGKNGYGLAGTETTDIPLSQVSITKDVFPVNNWLNVSEIKYVEVKKLQGMGRSLDDLHDKSIRLNWNKSLDLVSFDGWAGHTGLTNNALVATTTAAVGASGFTQWSKKTPQEIQLDINTAILATLSNSSWDVDGMADTILIPPAQNNLLLQPMTIAGCNSIMEYVLKNNLCRQNGIDLKIFYNPWLTGAGAGGTDQMIAYKRDRERLRLDITVPIQRAMTNFSVFHAAYLTLYAGQIGVVKVLYPQTLEYVIGI